MKQYIIFNFSEVNVIDFTQIEETSSSTLRKSKDGQKAVIKWDGDTPSCVSNLSSFDGPYNENEILTIMSTNYWWFTGGGGESIL